MSSIACRQKGFEGWILFCGFRAHELAHFSAAVVLPLEETTTKGFEFLGLHVGDESTDHVCSGALCTLLEQAKDEMFYWVCQVKVWSGSLKTLIARREKSFTSNLLKKQISLQQLVPSKARFEASAKFGLDPDTLDAFFANFSFSDLEQDLSCANLPDTVRSVAANFPCWDKSTPVDALRVFTDGSHFEVRYGLIWTLQ